MKANIRIITSAETKERADAILTEMESVLINSKNLQVIYNFENIMVVTFKRLFHDFSYRIFLMIRLCLLI